MPMFIKKHGIFLCCLLIFLLFLARNPFSTRTLIPNFEPYPDTIHYVVPARNFAVNNQFAIVREGRILAPRVPPLYSLFLIPVYMINSDPRSFYFGNVFLTLLSFFFFYLVVNKLVSTLKPIKLVALDSRLLIVFISLFLYITNYFNYWYPTLAMSENLTIFLFLLNIYLLTKPINKYTTIIGGFLPFSFFITKYAHATLTAAFLLSYGLKIIMETGWSNKKKLKKWGIFWGSSVFMSIFLLLFFELIPGISSIASKFDTLLPKQTSSGQPASAGTGWFSLTYMKEYLPKYIRALFGGYSVRFLWDNTPIIPLYIGIPGVIGLIWGIFNKHIRLLSITLLLTLFSSVFFMSAFYSLDMRYLYQLIPTILVGFVMFWIMAINGLDYYFCGKDKKHKSELISRSRLLIGILILALSVFYFFTNMTRFKKQIMLNLKYAETPWYYLSVLKLNEYFKSYPKNKPIPVVISSLVPYYVDFYSNGNYSLLPLSSSQEFRDNRKEAWGDFNYSDLIKLYYKVLYSGHELYVHNYGLGNEKVLHDDFNKIQEAFIMTKVAEGCYGTCNIWKLQMRWVMEWVKQKK